jgi:hypothetical protein
MGNMNRQLFCILALAICTVMISCGGGGSNEIKTLVAGTITGPVSIQEYYGGVYAITASGDSPIHYEWAVQPETAGTFLSPDSPITAFLPETVESSTKINVIVTITNDSGGLIKRIFDVTVRDIEGLFYGQIQGPQSLGTGKNGTYSIQVGGNAGFSYLWTCDPANSGIFSAPDKPSTEFSSTLSVAGTEIMLTVLISSTEYLDYSRSIKISLVESQANPPIADGVMLSTEPYLLDCVEFEDRSTDPDGPDEIANIEWDFEYHWHNYFMSSPSIFPQTRNPCYQYSTIGRKRVQLRVTDSSGLADFLNDPLLLDVNSLGWAVNWGSTRQDTISDIDLDSAGNIYSAGEYRNLINFDPRHGGAWLEPCRGYSDAYITRHTPDSFHFGAITWGSQKIDTANGMSIDENDYLYVVGEFTGEADFDPSDGEYKINGPGCYLAKFNTDGGLLWARAWNVENVTGLAVGPTYIYVIGNFDYLRPYLNPDQPDMAFSSVDLSSDFYVSQFDKSGNYIKTTTFGSTGSDDAGSIDTDAAGNYSLSGYSSRKLDLDPGSGTAFTNSDFTTYFIASYTPDGDFRWYAETDETNGYKIAVDNAGNTFVSDYSSDDTSTIRKFTPDGTTALSLQLGSDSGDVECYCLNTTESGDIIAGGKYSGHCDMDPGPGEYYPDDASSSTGFVLKLDSSGNFQWVVSIGNVAYDVDSSSDGSIYAGIEFSSSIDVNPNPDLSQWVNRYGFSDCLLIKLSPEGTWY